MEVYQKYSVHLQEKYGQKVYKIPIHLPVTCPNRDGTCGRGGCTFCGDVGTGYEMQEASVSISEQLQTNIDYIKKKYKAKVFIAYLQNYSNTYMPLTRFKEVLEQLHHPDMVGVSISTRPDCIRKEYLDYLEVWRQKTKYDVCIELGLQTTNYHSLKKINRGHGLAEYIDAVLSIKKYPFEICTHLILNLPWDTMEDTVESAKLMSVLGIDYVKLHALYIVKNTPMGGAYEKGEISMISLEEYKQRVIQFLRVLSKDVVVQRIIGRAPKEYTLFSNWDTSWWKIHDDIVLEMQEKAYCQGDLFNYTNGKALERMSGL
jgi:hypothetical protein